LHGDDGAYLHTKILFSATAEKEHEGEDLYVMVSTKFCVENVRRCRLYGRALKGWSNCTRDCDWFTSLPVVQLVNW
jgi:hypothetical protein